MKSIFLALLGFFLCLSIAAQAVPGTLSQNAQVLLELQVDGIHASHPDLPSGTEATITNEANGKTITVITSDRMPRSSGRVVNLSPAAARELEAGKGDWVKITIYNQRPLTTPNAQNTETHTNAQGNTVINNYYYIFDPDKLPDLANKVVDPNTARLDEILQNKTKDLESPAFVSEEIPEEPEFEGFSRLNSEETIVPGNRVNIIGLPNINSDKIYRLQVGAFLNNEIALNVLQQVQNGGFIAEMEQSGKEIYRVFAADIPARMVISEAQRLGELGFHEIWVREN